MIQRPPKVVLQTARHVEPKVIVKQCRQAEYDHLTVLPWWARRETMSGEVSVSSPPGRNKNSFVKVDFDVAG
jgi:hypothetical protein